MPAADAMGLPQTTRGRARLPLTLDPSDPPHSATRSSTSLPQPRPAAVEEGEQVPPKTAVSCGAGTDDAAGSGIIISQASLAAAANAKGSKSVPALEVMRVVPPTIVPLVAIAGRRWRIVRKFREAGADQPERARTLAELGV